jgi:hypothetical protein
MSIAKRCDQVYINDQIRSNEKLENIGPKKIANPVFAHRAHDNRVLELHNHEPTYGHPDKSDVEAKDFFVLDPKDFKGDIDVPADLSDLYRTTHFRTPYVWSKDWYRHEVEQEYCFKHPRDEQSKWVRGTQACGSASIRKGWSWFHPFRSPLPWSTSVDDGAALDDDEEEDVHSRGGEEEMMEIDDEDYAMDLASDFQEDNGLDMSRGEDEDEDMDLGGDGEDGDFDMDREDDSEDEMDTESTAQQPTITVAGTEASSRRVVNHSVSLMDED